MTETNSNWSDQPEVIGAAIERSKVAIRELILATHDMTDLTGGESASARDFTEIEHKVFDALMASRDRLQSMFPSIYCDINAEINEERYKRSREPNDPLLKLIDESPDQVHVVVVENRSGGIASIKAYGDRKRAAKESNAWRKSEHHWGSVHSVPVQGGNDV